MRVRHLRRVVPSLLASLLVAAGLAASPAVAERDARRDSGRIAGSFIVALREGVSHRQASAIARDHGGRVAHTYDRLEGFAFEGPDSAERGLAADRRVSRVEADRVVRALHGPPVPKLNFLGKTQAYRAYDAGYRGQGVRIAIIDTGVMRNHPVFGPDQVVPGHSCVGGGTGDREGHGTATAGNAAGRAGIAHDAKIVPVKVFRGASLTTSISKVICGLNYVYKANTNPNLLDDSDVVNMSLAFSGGNRALQKAVKRVLSTGTIVVAAAGNNGGATQAPARFGGVIAVTALAGRTKMASFSANGGDMTAPGVNIKSAENGGGFSKRSGTSRSSPMVAGGAAIILAEGTAPGSVLEVLRTSGTCPNGGINSDGGFCGGRWQGDDRNAEPLLNAYCAGLLADTGSLNDPQDICDA